MKLIAALLLVPALAMAEVTPDRGSFDARVRVVNYNPANVVKLATFYGVSTHVQFASDEVIKDVALGDTQAWEVRPRTSHLFIKPKAKQADTNLTVITDRRVYQFALMVQPSDVKDEKAWRNPDLIFSLSFKYPDDEAAASAIRTRVEAQRAQAGEAKSLLASAKARAENTDYWVSGSAEISPTAARDDGRFIYLSFSNNRDMPAVYTVSAEGDEALVQTNVEGNTIVVQRMSRMLRLRKGKAVACVVNKAYDIDGGRDNGTGTVSPDVKRVLKGGSDVVAR
ncbi:P-type conjugative transfer protein VirB9 (plasmid) [Sphaerotilaceae bacterium SBD11-9]